MIDLSGIHAVGCPVTALTLSHDSTQIIAGHHNGIVTLRPWNAFSSEPSLEIAAHRGAITSLVCLSGDPSQQEKSFLLTSSVDGTIKKWILPTGEWVTTLSGHAGTVTRVVVAENDRLFTCGVDGYVFAWNLTRAECISSLRVHVGRVSALTVARSSENSTSSIFEGGTKLFTASDDTLVKLIDFEKKEVLSVNRMDAPVTDLAFVYPTVFVSMTSGSIMGFDVESNRPTLNLLGHKDSINSLLVVRPPGLDPQLISASDDRSLIWWNLKSWSPMNCFTGHTMSILCCSADKNGTFFASAGYEGKIFVWQATRTLEMLNAAIQAEAEAAAAAKLKKKKEETKKPPPKRR